MEEKNNRKIYIIGISAVILLLLGILIIDSLTIQNKTGSLMDDKKSSEKKKNINNDNNTNNNFNNNLNNNQENIENNSDNVSEDTTNDNQGADSFDNNVNDNLGNVDTDNNNNSNNTNTNARLKILKCPTGGVSKMYNGYGQSSGIMCPAGSSSAGDITGKNAGRYTLKCIANSGYKFEGDCNVNWQITQGTNKATITFHKNIPGDNTTIVKEYDKSQKYNSFTIPNNWSRNGYVFAGWSEYPNAREATYTVQNDVDVSGLMAANSLTFADLYAVWVPVSHRYGNVIFIGDSYVNSAQWPKLTAEKLGLNGSYNLVHLPGTGFIRTANGYGEVGNDVNFLSLLKISDKIIADNNSVKKVVVAAGYNDKDYSYEQLKQAIISFGYYMHSIYPNATLYLAMTGTDFVDLTIESNLLTYIEPAYRDAAKSMYYAEYIPFSSESGSISNYLRWFGDYDGSYAHSCQPNNVTSSCYYLKEGAYGYHPSKTSGNIMADVISNYLKTH